jgi:uncharacterized membrane protein
LYKEWVSALITLLTLALVAIEAVGRALATVIGATLMLDLLALIIRLFRKSGWSNPVASRVAWHAACFKYLSSDSACVNTSSGKLLASS